MKENYERYSMNLGILNDSEMNQLFKTRVVIVGLGGLGGNVANQLVRLGVKHLTLIDFDTFSLSNLNRQLFSHSGNIGEYKVDVLKKELEIIDRSVHITTYKYKVQEVNLDVFDFLIDCVDNIETKVYLSMLSERLNIPLLHGSCGGWYGQVGWISPRCKLIEEMYMKGQGLEKKLLNPVFAPTVVSAYMVSEFTKMIKKSSSIIFDELLLIDLNSNALMKTGGE